MLLLFLSTICSRFLHGRGHASIFMHIVFLHYVLGMDKGSMIQIMTSTSDVKVLFANCNQP